MARRSFGRPAKNILEDRARQREEASDRKSALIKKMRAVLTRRAASVHSKMGKVARVRDNCEGSKYLSSLNSIPLRQLGSNAEARLALWYEMSILAAFDAMKHGTGHVLLSWPASQTCPSAVANLMAMAAVASARRTHISIGDRDEAVLAQADEFRALLFPYARSTHTGARQVQVDRTVLGSFHFDHYKRCSFEKAEPGTKDYHHVLSRVRELPGRAAKGKRRAEFEHPVLDELLPYGPALGERSANSELLWRSKNNTDIRKLCRTRAADDSVTATYFLYTIRANDRLPDQLKAIRKELHLAIFDLSRAGRARIGWNWQGQVKDAIRTVQEMDRRTGVLVLADDPWVYRYARFELLGSRRRQRKGKVRPAAGQVVFSRESSILADSGQSLRNFRGATEISVDGFYGEVDRKIEKLRGLARNLLDRGSASEAAAVRRVIATVRRSASLPGSLATFGRFLEAETTTAMAADLLEGYRVVGDLAALSDARSLASQLENEFQAMVGVRELMSSLQSATPMANLLNQAINEPLRSSSKSMVVFRLEMIAEFASRELTRLNPKLTEPLKNNIIRFGGAYLIEAVSTERQIFRNQFKLAIIVAPTSAAILATFAEPWLPERIVILADADTLLYAANEAERLASELDEESVVRRLRDFSVRAHMRVAEIGRHVVRFDHELPIEDIECSMDRLVDLRAGGRSERKVIEIVMHNGQRILARPSTHIVVRDDFGSANPFVEKLASGIRAGDEVCIIGPALVERAQTLVSVRTAAAGEIREYHRQVAARFDALPGGTVSEQLRHLVAEMGEPKVSPHTARYWINLDEELEKELDEIVPHAPHDRETFLRFTGALGIGPRLAENFWRWAVVAQRLYKMRAGNVLHDAFRGILTDPYSVLAENVDQAEKIHALRAIAEDHVATVIKISIVETG